MVSLYITPSAPLMRGRPPTTLQRPPGALWPTLRNTGLYGHKIYIDKMKEIVASFSSDGLL